MIFFGLSLASSLCVKVLPLHLENNSIYEMIRGPVVFVLAVAAPSGKICTPFFKGFAGESLYTLFQRFLVQTCAPFFKGSSRFELLYTFLKVSNCTSLSQRFFGQRLVPFFKGMFSSQSTLFQRYFLSTLFQGCCGILPWLQSSVFAFLCKVEVCHSF